MRACKPAINRCLPRLPVCWCATSLLMIAVTLCAAAQNPQEAARIQETPSAQGQNSAAGSAGASPQESPPAGLLLEETERRIGPLGVRGKNFTVVLRLKHVKDIESEETVSRLEIRDEAGNVAYVKDIPYQVEDDHFVETTEVTARELQGSLGRGLLLSYDVEPSTPLGGGSDQVFGLFDGKLVPFSNPISYEGNLALPDPPPEKVVKTSREPGFLGDVLDIRLWTGNVFLVVPVVIDWVQAKVRPAWRCQQLTSRGVQPVCVYKAEGERLPPTDDSDTFVRLFPDYFEPDATPQHVIIRKNSKVEVLQGAGILIWGEGKEIIGMGIGEELWLKVRIDGKEGWIHTDEDFNAAGLPMAG